MSFSEVIFRFILKFELHPEHNFSNIIKLINYSLYPLVEDIISVYTYIDQICQLLYYFITSFKV